MRLESLHPAGGALLSFRFAGRLSGDALAGTAELGTAASGLPNLVNRREYGEAAWTAKRG